MKLQRPGVLIGGRPYEDAPELRNRLRISETTLFKSVRDKGLPPPIVLGKRRLFDIEKVDAWCLTQTRMPSPKNASNK
jgi:predicted DNA-binding transcriptional regulator AlpA